MIEYKWTDGNDKDFLHFYEITEDYYTKMAGGLSKRQSFIPYNLSSLIPDVLIAYEDGTAVACAGLKKYSDEDVEIKRVWIEPEHRGRRIATSMMEKLEEKAFRCGYKRMILQTRPVMEDAVALYEKLGYVFIDNYPPYDKLEGAICLAKVITSEG